MNDTLTHGLDLEGPIKEGTAMLLIKELREMNSLLRQQAGQEEFVDVKEFMKRTNMKRSTLIHYLNTGVIKGTKMQGRTSPWRIPVTEIVRLRKEANG